MKKIIILVVAICAISGGAIAYASTHKDASSNAIVNEQTNSTSSSTQNTTTTNSNNNNSNSSSNTESNQNCNNNENATKSNNTEGNPTNNTSGISTPNTQSTSSSSIKVLKAPSDVGVAIGENTQAGGVIIYSTPSLNSKRTRVVYDKSCVAVYAKLETPSGIWYEINEGGGPNYYLPANHITFNTKEAKYFL